MIKYITTFLSVVSTMRGSILKASKLSSFVAQRGANHSFRMTNLFKLAYWWNALRLLILSNITFAMLMFLMAATISFIPELLNFLPTGTISWYNYLCTYIPFSGPDILTFIMKVGMFCTGWTIMVLYNHWDMINVIFDINNTGVLSALSTLAGQLYVINIDMIGDFVITVFTNPSGLLNTAFVFEIQSTFIHLGQSSQDVWNYSINNGPTILQPIINLIGSSLSTLCSHLSSWIGFSISTSWKWIVGGIQSGITPTCPTFIQPIIDPIFRSIATGIASSIVLYILRLILGI